MSAWAPQRQVPGLRPTSRPSRRPRGRDGQAGLAVDPHASFLSPAGLVPSQLRAAGSGFIYNRVRPSQSIPAEASLKAK